MLLARFVSVFFARCPFLLVAFLVGCFCLVPCSFLLFFFLCVLSVSSCFLVLLRMFYWMFLRYGHDNCILSWFSPTHLPYLSVVFFLTTSSSCSLVSGRRPCWRIATSCFCSCFFFSLLAVLCAYVVGGCSCGGVMLCRRCLCLLSLLFASSPKGASAHVMHAALFLSLCPLASCPVKVDARMLACLCATCARAR